MDRRTSFAVKFTLTLILSAVLMLAVINYYSDWLGTQGILINFFVFYILVNAVMYLPIYLVLKNVSRTLQITLGLSLAHAAFDTWLPPYAVDYSGQVFQSSIIGYTGSIDYLFGIIGQTLGVGGVGLWFFVYMVCPSVILLMSLYLLGAQKYLKEF